MSNYISKISKSSYFRRYFRSIVPKDLRSVFGGTTEFRLSLGSCDEYEARVICLKLKQLTDNIFIDVRRGMKSLSLDEIKNILRIEVRKQILHSQHYYLGTNEFDEDETRKSLEALSSREDNFKEGISGKKIKNYERELDKKLEGILQSLEIFIEPNSVNYKNLRRKFIQLYLLRFDWIKTLLKERGNVDEDIFRKEVDSKLGMDLFPDLQTQSVGSSIPANPVEVSSQLNSLQSTPISKCTDLFIGEKDGVREKTERENRYSIRFLTECFGDIPIGLVDKEKSNTIKNHIRNYPKNRTKNPKYRDKDFHSLMKMKIPDNDKIHLTTINKHLDHLSSFMSWCVNNGYSDMNPFAGVKIKQKKSPRDERDRFSEKELKQIFSKNNYLYYAEVEKDNYYRYWVPLIGVFTGMRLGEICSLYLDNVREIAGSHRKKRWCLDILEEPNRPDKKLKTQSSRRIIPIHDTLLDLGFIDFVKLLKKEPNRKRLFEELKYREGIYGREMTRFWGKRYLPLLGVKTEKNGFHSLRHSVIDHLKQVGVEPHFIAEYVGQKHGSMTMDRYGKGYNPDILYNKCVKKIVYQTSHTRGIDFLSLKLNWRKIMM